MSEKVILVNENDEWLGLADKMEAHTSGLLHRAFSVFILNDKNEMLIHKRALHKYHSGGLWSNACCSHPRYGESTLSAAKRRLNEELGIQKCQLKKLFTHHYKLEVDNELTEHEYDHIFMGKYNSDVNINTDEVADYKFVPIDELQQLIQKEPHSFSVWFKALLPTFLDYISARAA